MCVLVLVTFGYSNFFSFSFLSGIFPLSSYDQLSYVPGERLHWAQLERDAILHDKRHLIGTLVEGVFHFDDRRY